MMLFDHRWVQSPGNNVAGRKAKKKKKKERKKKEKKRKKQG
jgi:hypothetical protein